MGDIFCPVSSDFLESALAVSTLSTVLHELLISKLADVPLLYRTILSRFTCDLCAILLWGTASVTVDESTLMLRPCGSSMSLDLHAIK